MFENYVKYEYYFAHIQIVLFMVGMGATLVVGDFVRVFRHPRSFVFGLAAQWLFVPAVAVLVNHVADLPPGIAIGLILVALMPSATLSKFFAHLGKGNLALCITMTVTTTLATLFTVPLMLELLVDIPGETRVPADEVMMLVGVYLLLPLAVGMLVARIIPRHKRIFSRICVGIGWVVVALMVIGALGSGRIRPGDYGVKVPIAIIVFCLLIQQGSMIPFYVFRWPRPDRLAVGIETTMRNMNLALLLQVRLFPSDSASSDIGDAALFVILYYAAVAMAAGFPLALNHLRMARKEARRNPHPPQNAPAALPRRDAPGERL